MTAQERLQLKMRVESLDQAKVLVIGDPIYDYYHFGRVDRLSPEAPVPIFIETDRQTRAGGALNVQANLKALGASVYAINPITPWTAKHRYLVGSHHLFRVDADICYPAITLNAHIEKAIEIADVLVLSDYAKGALAAPHIGNLIACAHQKSTVVIVDPKGRDWEKYAGAHILCPNEAEVAAFGKSLERWSLPHDLIIKRGEAGLTVRERLEVAEEKITEIPARARHVFDVTGAGDTVVAVLAAAIAVNATIEQAAYLANLAAGVVVGEVGTSVCTQKQLMEEIDHA